MRAELLTGRRMIIDPFSDRNDHVKMPEEMAEVKAGIDEKVERMLEEYARMEVVKECTYDDCEEKTSKMKYETMTPAQIDLLLKIMIKTTDAEKTSDVMTGMFITKLIQKSYKSGANDFIISTLETQFEGLGYRLRGTGENPLRISINGNAGKLCGWYSKNCIYTINGNTEDECGEESENCTYNIQGNTEDICGYASKNCAYTIEGSAGILCGEESKNSRYTIAGNAGEKCGYNSERCTFEIKGDVNDNCGDDSRNNTYIIAGNAGEKCGFESGRCTFTIAGRAEDYLGLSSDECIYETNGNIGKKYGINSQDSTYRTTQPKNYRKMLRNIPQGNKVQLVDKEGNIMMERIR